MTKLVIQIPCYNEEEILPKTLAELPRELDGIDRIELLVIDDGSEDGTVEVARKAGVHRVVRFPQHRGLAEAFKAGLEASMAAGADIIVNTDADNQYDPADIPQLIQPILDGSADLVIGSRSMSTRPDFSLVKRLMQRLGSWGTRVVSNTDVADAPSGFRAMSRDAAMKLQVFNDYTYTVETIIQAGQKGMAVRSVPVRTRPTERESRLVRSTVGYVNRQVLTMLRIFMTYRPFRFFALPGAISFGVGFLVGLRFIYFYLNDQGQGHVQSLILAALLMGSGLFLVIVGLVADLISVNRKLLEGLDWRLKKLEEGAGRLRRESEAEEPVERS